MPAGHVRANDSRQPLGIEIALVTADVSGAHRQALSSGAQEVSPPLVKPWGQTVSYLRCPDGLLVELCSPMTEE
ncbi:hypothetical protein D9M68_979810 [compost metagenome]